MPNKILNTNMGLGFRRGRKYDMDLSRLGRMETSHSELRKTRDLNLQTEMRKLKESMKTYSVRRFSSYPYKTIMTESELREFSDLLQREFGMGDAVGGVVNGARDLTGNVVEGAGKVVGSGLGKLAAGGFGAMKGAALGTAAALSNPLTAVFAPLAGTVGAIGGGLLGATAAEAGGSTLKNIGQDIHT